MRRVLRIIVNAVSVLLVAGFVTLSAWLIYWESADNSSTFTSYYLLYMAFAIFSMLTASALHECGHTLFGLLSGVRAKLTLKSMMALLKPSSVEIVPKTDKNLKPRIIFTALGGVAINLIFTIFGVLALVVTQIPTWLSGIAVCHIALFIDNVFPVEYKTGKSDGLVIWELIKNYDSAKVMLSVLTVQAQILNGKPIEEVDEKLLFDLPQIAEDEPAFISLTELRAEYFSAKGDEEQADKHYARLEQLKNDYLN